MSGQQRISQSVSIEKPFGRIAVQIVQKLTPWYMSGNPSRQLYWTGWELFFKYTISRSPHQFIYDVIGWSIYWSSDGRKFWNHLSSPPHYRYLHHHLRLYEESDDAVLVFIWLVAALLSSEAAPSHFFSIAVSVAVPKSFLRIHRLHRLWPLLQEDTSE